MVQIGEMSGRRIIDEDGDGVEDNVHKTQGELDRFRKMVFGASVEDLHNTRHGELPGHVRYGDFPEPENLQTSTDMHADDRAENEYDSEPKEAQSIAQIRPIIDKDGDGVEDNVEKTQEELDRHRKKVFGEHVHDLHNTRHGELPGHVRFGDFPEPTGVHVQDRPFQSEDVSVAVDANLGANVDFDDRSMNEGDASYLQTSEQKLSNYIQIMNSPDDLALLQTRKHQPRLRKAIYDADGDGVEDNLKLFSEDLDDYYIPAVFGVAEDLFNTHNGELPGHVQKAFDASQGEPADTYSIVNHPWATK